jgi:hypothetical protein
MPRRGYRSVGRLVDRRAGPVLFKPKLRGQRDLKLSNLVLTATYAFEVLRSGRVGIGGSTATVLVRCLAEMRSLLDDPKPAAD